MLSNHLSVLNPATIRDCFHANQPASLLLASTPLHRLPGEAGGGLATRQMTRMKEKKKKRISNIDGLGEGNRQLGLLLSILLDSVKENNHVWLMIGYSGCDTMCYIVFT